MTLGVTEDHRALHDTARRWVEARGVLGAARATLDAPTDALPPFWAELAELGWLGLHVGEGHGGSGFGLAELAVVLEELGRAVAPGPILPTVLASTVIDRLGGRRREGGTPPGAGRRLDAGDRGLRLDPVGDRVDRGPERGHRRGDRRSHA